MPRVSIVMPVYNGEQYLKESIESILSQTFQDWELWLVNDCSTDSSPQIMEEYTKRDPRVHMLSNLENQKLPRTLNIGFRHAGGEYLTWTSDDNRYKESAIERMVQALEENPSYGMAYSSMEYLQEDGITLTPPTVDLSRICVEDPIGAFTDVSLAMLIPFTGGKYWKPLGSMTPICFWWKIMIIGFAFIRSIKSFIFPRPFTNTAITKIASP